MSGLSQCRRTKDIQAAAAPLNCALQDPHTTVWGAERPMLVNNREPAHYND
jgi:hypothetical protein